VLLLLALVIAAAKAAGAAANRIGQPAVFGEILVGLLLGPPCSTSPPGRSSRPAPKDRARWCATLLKSGSFC